MEPPNLGQPFFKAVNYLSAGVPKKTLSV